MFEGLFHLGGKVVVVTGAGSGFGRAFALGLSAFGATVVCGGRRLAALTETVRQVEAAGGQARALVVDVADPDSVEGFWRAFEERHNRVDVLINNAGITAPPKRVHELAIADWDHVVATNLRGTFLFTRAALPRMQPGPGAVINVASIAGMRGYWPGFPSLGAHYAAAKAGIVGFTRQAAAEYARDGIRVNAIAPGWHGGTDLIAGRRAASPPAEIERFESELRRRIPMGRRGQPEDLVGLVIYLASDAASYVTGQVIVSDGGWDAAVS